MIKALIDILYGFAIDIIEHGDSGRNKEIFSQIRNCYGSLGEYRELLQPELDEAMVACSKGRDRNSALEYLGHAVRDIIPDIEQDRSVSRTDIEIIKALGLFLRSDSDSAYNKIVRFASHTGNSWIAQQLDQGHDAQQDDDLRVLVKKLANKDDNKLTIEEAKEARERKPELYKEYLKLRREYMQVYKDALASFVRQSGKTLVPMEEFEEYLHQHNIESSLPEGFTGYIDDLGRFYTADQLLIDGVPNSTTFPSIVMNPDYGKTGAGQWVFMAQREDGSPGPYFYTVEFKKQQTIKKFDKVQQLMPKLENMRKKWFRKVKDFDVNDQESVIALILETLFQFSARIGNVGNRADNQPTYGISTLQVRHVYPQSNGDIILRYDGKDGVRTTHKILARDPQQKYLAKAILFLTEEKNKNERLFTYDRGEKFVPISSSAVNSYFRKLGAPAGVTVHKLRTYKGSVVFQELMDKELARKDLPSNDKQAMDLLKKMATVVGTTLNHVRRSASGEQKITPTTALNSYIDVTLQKEYFDRLGLRYPKYLEKAL